jgi:hypothetical protein
VENGSRPRANRHGIQIRGKEPAKCIWPRCSGAVATYPLTNLCDLHAQLVHNAVAQDLNKLAAVIKLRREPSQPAPERTLREEVIYYVQVGGHIKIGWTSQLEQRMRNYPPNTVLLAVHPGSRSDERKLHRRFAVHRSHGQEWYPLVPVVLDHIKRMLAEHGSPPVVFFGARPVEVPQPRSKPTLQAKYGPMTVS